MGDDDVAFAGPLHQSKLLREGALHAADLVDLYLDRIERHNPRVNVFVSVRPEAALLAAAQAQESLDRGDPRPLLGIPFAVKDEHDLAGEVTSHGTGATTAVATRDSRIVEILRRAGAIPIGKTTLPELGMHPFTESRTWGVTRNPWNLSRTPGGSSGGSAAAVAAGLVSFATAGDGGGSLRIPASCCNLFGLKVQRDRVPVQPHPVSAGGLSVFGVLTRGVADAALVYDVLCSAPDRTVPSVWERSLRESVANGAGRLRVGMAFNLGMRSRVAPEVRRGVEHVARSLERLGHVVSDVRVDPGSWLLPFTILGTCVLVDEARRLAAPDRLERRTRTALRTGRFMGPRARRWAERRQAATIARVNRVFADVDLVLTPTLAEPPVDAGRWESTGALRTSRGVGRWCPYTSLWNFVGQPAASIPAGFTTDGLPLGAQLLGPSDAEPMLVAVASQLEDTLEWTRARPPL